jgi:hypothetical protein
VESDSASSVPPDHRLRVRTVEMRVPVLLARSLEQRQQVKEKGSSCLHMRDGEPKCHTRERAGHAVEFQGAPNHGHQGAIQRQPFSCPGCVRRPSSYPFLSTLIRGGRQANAIVFHGEE